MVINGRPQAIRVLNERTGSLDPKEVRRSNNEKLYTFPSRENLLPTAAL